MAEYITTIEISFSIEKCVEMRIQESLHKSEVFLFSHVPHDNKDFIIFPSNFFDFQTQKRILIFLHILVEVFILQHKIRIQNTT